MAVSSYLESVPLNEIAKYAGVPPKNGIPFIGYPQQHPAEKDKIILIYEAPGGNPMVLEFKLDDVLFVEELHSAVTEAGEAAPLVKLWIRQGAHGVILEPFEVDEPPQFAAKHRDIQERLIGGQAAARAKAGLNSGVF